MPVSSACSRGIIHRDIKGQNILVDNAGVCKLADFGASRYLQKADSAAALSFKGTPVFMSPEVCFIDFFSLVDDACDSLEAQRMCLAPRTAWSRMLVTAATSFFQHQTDLHQHHLLDPMSGQGPLESFRKQRCPSGRVMLMRSCVFL